MKEKDYNYFKVAYIAGYMLKVIKNERQGNKFKDEFNAIKHCNYNEFINKIGEDIPPMTVWNAGVIHNNLTTVEGQCDFVGLMASGPSLDKFYEDIKNEFGEINDEHFSDEVFRKLIIFEVRIRMHITNRKPEFRGESLENFINELKFHFPLTKKQINIIHEGRKFLNNIKHNQDKIDLWKDDLVNFENAFSILDKYKISG